MKKTMTVNVVLFLGIALLAINGCVSSSQNATIAGNYYVSQRGINASDDNQGSEEKPFKTISGALSKLKLEPGDTLWIKNGVYREKVVVEASGTKQKPVSISAFPGHKVMVLGSELIIEKFEKISFDNGLPDPYPNSSCRLWKLKLGDKYFADHPVFKDKSKRVVTLLMRKDGKDPLRMLGDDPRYPMNEGLMTKCPLGRGAPDQVGTDSFWFDRDKQELYLRSCSNPGGKYEMGVRNNLLRVVNQHDIIIRGIEFRYCRNPKMWGSVGSIKDCKRINILDCKFRYSDFCGLTFGTSEDCVVDGCDMSLNGNTGINPHKTKNLTVKNSTIMHNNWMDFYPCWHAGGLKAIPDNVGLTVRNCVVAWNRGDGIWLDVRNTGYRILDNVCYANNGGGIYSETNPPDGLIAGNLCFNNKNGIWISGSSSVTVCYNTCVANDKGIYVRAKPRSDADDNTIVNNLVIGGCADLLNEYHVMAQPDLDKLIPNFKNTMKNNTFGWNYYSNSYGRPRFWHVSGNTYDTWREKYGYGENSKFGPAIFERGYGWFRIPDADILKKELRFATPVDTSKYKWTAKNPDTVGCGFYEWSAKPLKN